MLDQPVAGFRDEPRLDHVRQPLAPLTAAAVKVHRVQSELTAAAAALRVTAERAQASLAASASVAHQLAAAITPDAALAISNVNRLAPMQRFAASMRKSTVDVGAQLVRQFTLPAFSFALPTDPFRSIAQAVFPRRVQQIGYPSAPDQILEILEKLAEQRVLPRLRGLTRRASRIVFDFYDAIRVRAQEAVESHVGPTSVPRHYRRNQSEQRTILCVRDISPHRQVEHCIGHLQIRAPGSDDAGRHSSSQSLNGVTQCSDRLPTSPPRRTPRSRSASVVSCRQSQRAPRFLARTQSSLSESLASSQPR